MKTGTSWKTFLEAHWSGSAALDFFTVEVLTLFGIVRYHVLFAIRLETREVHIAGMTAQPDERWMKQIAGNLTDPFDGFLNDAGYLIMDRDPPFTTSFRTMLKESGTKPVRLPSRKHLRNVIKDYMEHYHIERNHQGLGSSIIHPDENVGKSEGVVRTRSRLGGFLNYYYRTAA